MRPPQLSIWRFVSTSLHSFVNPLLFRLPLRQHSWYPDGGRGLQPPRAERVLPAHPGGWQRTPLAQLHGHPDHSRLRLRHRWELLAMPRHYMTSSSLSSSCSQKGRFRRCLLSADGNCDKPSENVQDLKRENNKRLFLPSSHRLACR